MWGSALLDLVQPELLHTGKSSFQVFEITFTFIRMHTSLMRETGGQTSKHNALNLVGGYWDLVPFKFHQNYVHACEELSNRLACIHFKCFEFVFRSVVFNLL